MLFAGFARHRHVPRSTTIVTVVLPWSLLVVSFLSSHNSVGNTSSCISFRNGYSLVLANRMFNVRFLVPPDYSHIVGLLLWYDSALDTFGLHTRGAASDTQGEDARMQACRDTTSRHCLHPNRAHDLEAYMRMICIVNRRRWWTTQRTQTSSSSCGGDGGVSSLLNWLRRKVRALHQ